jgi:X-Pro dipeptidyl-peptidase
MSNGFNDWNVIPELRNRIYQALKKNGVPVQLYYHQNGHGGPPPMKMMNRWFTRYLHGVQNGVEKEPRAWIVRETADRAKPTSYADYPHPDAQFVTWHLNSGAPDVGKLTIKTPKKQGTETLIDNFSFSGSTLAKAESTNHRLLYVTPKFKKPVHISGTPKVTIKLASNKPAANLSVWLVSLPWNENRNARITDNIITRGWADPQNRESLTKSEPLEPGKFYEVSFALQPDDQVIAAGQQIGLMIFSSDREFTLHPKPGTQLTIDLDATSLSIPIVGGDKAFKNAINSKGESS